MFFLLLQDLEMLKPRPSGESEKHAHTPAIIIIQRRSFWDNVDFVFAVNQD